MIQFNTPEWFFLLPLLLATGWKYRRLRLASPLRLLLQTCLLLALAQPALDRGGKDMDLWVLVDQSNSTARIPAAGAEEIQAILERHKHAGDRVDWWISRNPPCSGDAETPSLPGEPPERTWNRPWPIPWP